MKKNKIFAQLIILGTLLLFPGTILLENIPLSLAEPENCHLIGQPSDFNANNIYAPPFDIFSAARPLMMQAICKESEITLSFSGDARKRLFREGFIFQQGNWKGIEFSGSTAEDFLTSPAQAVFRSSDDSMIYAIFYVCAATPDGWKCGCQTTECTNTSWNIQAIKPPMPIARNFYHEAEDRLKDIRLPEGFFIHYYAKNVENARSLAIGNKGTVFVGSRSAGRVYALSDENGDLRADKQFEIAKGLQEPNGVAFWNGSLYVAEISRIIRFDNIENLLENPPEPVVVYEDLPRDHSHGWKYLAIGPDEKLYFGIGAPCNVCEKSDPRYATLNRLGLDGSGFETIAGGVRNSVGFDWQPRTGELYFTDNGRDILGDDNPPDELNRLTKTGSHFGFPYCHGTNVADPELGKPGNCLNFTPPFVELGPHVAALGMKFYKGDMFPEAYQGDVFIAEHGSWNRSKKIGYRITLVDMSNGVDASYQPFAEGFLQGENAWGRPVDILELPDGSLLVSDDTQDAVYRIGYMKE